MRIRDTQQRAAMALFFVLALASGARAQAVKLDWDDAANAWPPGSLSQTFSIGSGDVTLTFTGATGALTSNAPNLQQTPTGGLVPAENSLLLDVDFPQFGPNELTLSLDFSSGVSNVSFSIFDVDRNVSGNPWDEVQVTATDGSTTFNPSSVVASPGNAFVPLNVVTGVSNVNATSSDGNATFTFNQSGITRVTIRYRFPGGASDAAPQSVALHDVSFNQSGGGGGPNNPPVAVDDAVATTADTPLSIDVLANDSDPDGGSVRLIPPAATSNQGGTVAVDDHGTPLDRTDDLIDYAPLPGFNGVDSFVYTIEDGLGATDSATVTVSIVGEFDVALALRSDRDRAVVGELVSYTLTARNIGLMKLTDLTLIDQLPPSFSFVVGSARLNGAPITPAGIGTLSFTGLVIPFGQSATVTYLLRVGAGVTHGAYVSRASALFQGQPLGQPSSATVVVAADPEFEQATILGKVFHDRDGDGWQDPGEEGIPGVRLATVGGLVVETDSQGRYHLAGIDGGFLDRGSNFIIKVDPATLPPEAEFTTANPLVRRITQGTPSRFDFGVRLPWQELSCCTITELTLGEIHFSATSDVVWPEFVPALEELAKRLKAHGGGTLVLEGLSETRVQRVYEMLRQLLGDELIRKVTLHGPGELAPPPDDCKPEHCAAEPGYDVEIVSPGGNPGSSGTPAGQGASPVELRGRFTVSLPQGGTLWATEDPSEVEPRLALGGPDRAPLLAGRISAAQTFYVYTNYASFIDHAELVFYLADDIDRVDPVATLPVPVRSYAAVEWDGAADRQLHAGDEIVYLLRASDGAGHFDETKPRLLQLVDARSFEPTSPRPIERRTAAGPAGGATAPPPATTPLAGNILVLRPPAPVRQTSTERKLYTLRPEFDERKLGLSDTDKAELDRIVGEVSRLENLRLDVAGHTDSGGIPEELRDRPANAYDLSEVRARVVADYLREALELPAPRVTVVGRGADEPVASNFTEDGRALNRRVEVRVAGDLVSERIEGPADIKLVQPATGASVSARRGLTEAELRLREKAAPRETAAPAAEPQPGAVKRPGTAPEWDADALAAVYGRSDLVRQTIPIRGGRVRVYGQDLPAGYELAVAGLPVPVDANGRFAAEYLLPVGRHELPVSFRDVGGNALEQRLSVEVRGQQLFFIALGDLTAAGQKLNGSVESLAGNERFDKDFLAEGRLALYLKGKIKGKYLLTAQLDTTEKQLSDLLRELGEEEPSSVFRRLDPDRYYPVYGDDSTTRSDTDTQGRMYVRLDWDRSTAMWGNFHTGFTGNEFAQYNRSLYGAKLEHRSLQTTSLGDSRTEASVFVSQAQTAPGHAEFGGTGGSLFYLRHRDVLPGSDKARVEIRDRDSGRVLDNITLERGADYEIDELQGRILLARPLQQVADPYRPSLVKDEPLDGNDVVLLVDYEYVPEGFEADQVTAGARGRGWISDHIALGATYVDEKREGEDYQLVGGDATLQAGRGTYVKLEYAGSQAAQAPRFFSDNGGLSFARLDPVGSAARDGQAYGVEARTNLKELTGGRNDWVAAGWWRSTDAGFSVARRDTGIGTTEYGAEVAGAVGQRLKLAARASVVTREPDAEDQRYSVQGDWSVSRHGTVSAEVRHLSRQVTAVTEPIAGTLGAVRYRHVLNARVDLFATGQYTIDDDQGRYDANDLGTVGARVRVGERAHVQGEVSTGDRGDAGRLTADWRVNPDHELYGTYTHSVDRTEAPRADSIALGQRSRLSNQTTVFSENQFVRTREEAGLARVFGLDFAPRPGWNVGFSLQSGELAAISGGIVDRSATALVVGHHAPRAQWTTRLERRDDGGAERRKQWLTSNRIDWKIHDGLRLLGRLNLSRTDDELVTADPAHFVEGGLGLAYRPTRSDRWNVLGKYTYLYDLPASAQERAGTDQRSHVLALEGIARLAPRWELGGKLAERLGELRTDRDAGTWFKSTASFGAFRLGYDWLRRWDALVELRGLKADEARSTRSGFLVAINRHLGEHFKVGTGYNFTDFSDDLTDLDYRHQGWFVNFVTLY